jgi:GntR family transcriptional regulator
MSRIFPVLPKISENLTPLPLHLAISEQLRSQIIEGVFPSGEQLPSEHQLMSQFQVSRITVRRAIANLVSQGLVVSQRGRGVFVKPQQKVTRSLSSPLSFFDADFGTDLAQQGVTTSFQDLSFEAVRATDEVIASLQLELDQQWAYCQKKVIWIDRIPVALDVAYVPLELGRRMANELQSGLTYSTLDRNGILIERVEVRMECTHAAHEVSTHLETCLGAPLLVNRYVAYTSGDRPVICGETLSRADRLCYSIVLTKEQLGES